MIDVTVPQLGESVTEGTISKWLVKEGDVVVKDQAIALIATDKADSEPAQFASVERRGIAEAPLTPRPTGVSGHSRLRRPCGVPSRAVGCRRRPDSHPCSVGPLGDSCPLDAGSDCSLGGYQGLPGDSPGPGLAPSERRGGGPFPRTV